MSGNQDIGAIQRIAGNRWRNESIIMNLGTSIRDLQLQPEAIWNV